jgi:hypothetical protein
MSDTAWAGRLVHPGTVFASVAGNSAVDSVHFDITPRNWGVLPVDTVSLLIGAVALRPPIFLDTSPIQMGLHYGREVDVGASGRDINVVFSGGYASDDIPAGPNQGYHFVASTTYGVPRGYSINPWLSPRVPYHGSNTTVAYVNNQPGVNAQDALDGVLAHEVRGPFRSHFARWKIASNSVEGCGDLYTALEKLVSPSLGTLRFREVGARSESLRVMRWASWHEFVQGHLDPSADKVAEWRTPSPSLLGLDDPPEQPIPDRQPPAADVCDVGALR